VVVVVEGGAAWVTPQVCMALCRWLRYPPLEKIPDEPKEVFDSQKVCSHCIVLVNAGSLEGTEVGLPIVPSLV
jgi:hypothetical protein